MRGHDWSTVPKEGLAGMKNGELFAAIEGKWDVLLTTDTNIPWQQVVARFLLAVVIIRARSNDIEDLLPWAAETLRALSTVKPGQSREVGDPDLLGR